jgi:hypothetical protein
MQIWLNEKETNLPWDFFLVDANKMDSEITHSILLFADNRGYSCEYNISDNFWEEHKSYKLAVN